MHQLEHGKPFFLFAQLMLGAGSTCMIGASDVGTTPERGLGRVKVTALALFGMTLCSCQGVDPPATEKVGTLGAALSANAARVLGFEDPSFWSLSAGKKARSLDHSEGEASLEVSEISWAEIVSTPLSTADIGNPAHISVDLKLPATQPNPYWFGAAQLYLESPSRNLFNAFVAQRELTGLPTERFVSLVFEVPQWIRNALSSGASDLKLKIALNVPSGSGKYRLDNLVVKSAADPSTRLSGTWTTSIASDFEQPVIVTLQLRANSSYLISARSGDVALSEADGTWVATASTLKLRPEHCAVLDVDAGRLLASTEDCEEEESSYRIEGSSLTVTSGDGTTSTETVYQRQAP